MQKRFLYTVFLLLPYFIFSQEKKQQEKIDALIEVTNEIYMDYKMKDVLSMSQEIINQSEEIDYEKGLVYGNFYFAESLSHIGQHKESVEYIRKAEKYADFLATDPMQKSRLNSSLALNYQKLGLYTLSIQQFHKAIDVLEKKDKKNVIDSLTISTTFGCLSILYNEMDLTDSSFYYLNEEKEILQKVKLEDSYVEKSYNLISFGDYYLKLNNLESAENYYQNALNELQGKNHFFEINAYIGFADLKFQQKKYDQALQFYEKSLQLSENHEWFQQNLIYEKLSETHEILGNESKANEFHNLFHKAEDQIQKTKQIERDFIINQVLQHEKQQNQKRIQKRTRTFVILSFAFALVLVGLFFYFMKKRKKILQEKEEIIHQKEEEAIQLQKETQKLKLKVNDSFEEIVQLAKENHPEFFKRFQEVYPEFRVKLLEINPDLKPSELVLAAYTFLGFNTKDIADYTFKAVQTIKNNKRNLRKKLGLSTDENFPIWIWNQLDLEK